MLLLIKEIISKLAIYSITVAGIIYGNAEIGKIFKDIIDKRTLDLNSDSILFLSMLIAILIIVSIHVIEIVCALIRRKDTRSKNIDKYLSWLKKNLDTDGEVTVFLKSLHMLDDKKVINHLQNRAVTIIYRDPPSAVVEKLTELKEDSNLKDWSYIDISELDSLMKNLGHNGASLASLDEEFIRLEKPGGGHEGSVLLTRTLDGNAHEHSRYTGKNAEGRISKDYHCLVKYLDDAIRSINKNRHHFDGLWLIEVQTLADVPSSAYSLAKISLEDNKYTYGGFGLSENKRYLKYTWTSRVATFSFDPDCFFFYTDPDGVIIHNDPDPQVSNMGYIQFNVGNNQHNGIFLDIHNNKVVKKTIYLQRLESQEEEIKELSTRFERLKEKQTDGSRQKPIIDFLRVQSENQPLNYS